MGVSALNDRIDRLYQLPPGEFTAARNALAKTLAGADRKHVQALQKPTLVPWAINQLYWHARMQYDRLITAGLALRSAQIDALEGRPSSMPRATAAHRKALAEASATTVRLAKAGAVALPPDALARMLEALSLAPAANPGRFTNLVHPLGFEALAGVSPARAEGSIAAPAAGAIGRSGESVAQERVHAEERRRAQQAVTSAEASLALAREVEARAQRDLAAAEGRLAEVRASVDRAREATHEAARRLSEALRHG